MIQVSLRKPLQIAVEELARHIPGARYVKSLVEEVYLADGRLLFSFGVKTTEGFSSVMSHLSNIQLGGVVSKLPPSFKDSICKALENTELQPAGRFGLHPSILRDASEIEVKPTHYHFRYATNPDPENFKGRDFTSSSTSTALTRWQEDPGLAPRFFLDSTNDDMLASVNRQTAQSRYATNVLPQNFTVRHFGPSMRSGDNVNDEKTPSLQFKR